MWLFRLGVPGTTGEYPHGPWVGSEVLSAAHLRNIQVPSATFDLCPYCHFAPPYQQMGRILR